MLPGSKSISNRALLLAALCKNPVTLKNLLIADDTNHMINSLRQLGVSLELSGTTCVVSNMIHHKNTNLHIGNAGTAMRSLTAVLSALNIPTTLLGEDRMYERPIKELVDGLSSLGADIKYLKTPGYPPIKIKESTMTSGYVEVDGSKSSQYISALLMAGPLLGGLTIKIINPVSFPYVLITTKMMASFGVDVKIKGDIIEVPAGEYNATEYYIEPDASSASYFLGAAAISGSVSITGLKDSIQGDSKFIDVLGMMGAKIDKETYTCKSDKLHGICVDMKDMPDVAMTLAVVALFAEGPTTIKGIGNWRIKETDRISAMCTELEKTGANITEGPDYIIINPTTDIKPCVIDTYNDHRIAMCFSLLSLAEGGIINNPGCCSKTYPNYFTDFYSMGNA